MCPYVYSFTEVKNGSNVKLPTIPWSVCLSVCGRTCWLSLFSKLLRYIILTCNTVCFLLLLSIQSHHWTSIHTFCDKEVTKQQNLLCSKFTFTLNYWSLRFFLKLKSFPHVSIYMGSPANIHQGKWYLIILLSWLNVTSPARPVLVHSRQGSGLPGHTMLLSPLH